MEDHGPVGEFDEGLGKSEGERSQAGAEATDEDERCTASEKGPLEDRNRPRVPFMFTACQSVGVCETGPMESAS